jgi:hypothetical protein
MASIVLTSSLGRILSECAEGIHVEQFADKLSMFSNNVLVGDIR